MQEQGIDPAVPTLDAHAHLRRGLPPSALEPAGAVLAMTLSIAEARAAPPMRGALVVGGVGCHPCHVAAQATFDRDEFEALVEATPIVGEVGLDAGSRVPSDVQLRTFRAVLRVVAGRPRLVSIHAGRAASAVLDELRRTCIAVPVLHAWTGTADETRAAVGLGCSFSLGATVMRRGMWRAVVPPDRLLVESDQGWSDPPSAIPHKIAWIEQVLAARLGVDADDVRALAWRNLRAIVLATGTRPTWPAAFAALLGPA